MLFHKQGEASSSLLFFFFSFMEQIFVLEREVHQHYTRKTSVFMPVLIRVSSSTPFPTQQQQQQQIYI